MKLNDLVLTSKLVADTSGRLEKIALLAALLKRLAPNEVPIAIGFLTGWPRQGKLGVGWASVAEARPSVSAATPTLDLVEVDETFTQLQSARGKRSGAERQRILSELLSRSTADEQSFLAALAIGEVRQGALDGVLTEAVARAADLPSNRVRRAVMLAGDLGTVAEAVLTEGEAGLSRYALQLFRPVQPMLADAAPTVNEALGSLGTAVIEWKL
ncbi:MAG: ATP-dependent DNA ligase, partial [Gemmatimonadetes bacterium]